MKYTDRAYIFDNSSIAYLIAEITGAEDFDPKVEDAPAWFNKYVLEKIGKQMENSELTIKEGVFHDLLIYGLF